MAKVIPGTPIYEHLMQHKDSNGETSIIFPITTVSSVIGSYKVVDDVANMKAEPIAFYSKEEVDLSTEELIYLTGLNYT